MPPPNSTPITAAGRVISGANADRLLDAHRSLVAGVQSLSGVLTDTGHLAASLPAAPFNVSAIARTLTQTVDAQCWRIRVETTLEVLYRVMVRGGTSDDIDQGVAILRDAIAAYQDISTDSPVEAWLPLDHEAFDDEDDLSMDGAIAYRSRYFVLHIGFGEFVARLNKALERPDYLDGAIAILDQFEAFLRGQLRTVAASADAIAADPADTLSGAPADETIAAIATDTLSSAAPDPEPIEVAAASGESEAEWDLAIAASATVAEDDDAIAIEGILFRVDEPSECIPEQGPGLPLFIPASVAAAALDRVMGRPLDAHESLAAHGGGVVGAIVAGEVRDRDGIIQGFLHNYHVPDRVSDIRAAATSGQLGMSMLGKIAWHRGEVDGREVAIVDRLTLRGGTILRANTATYRKTRVRLVSARDRLGNTLPLTAIAQPDPQPEDASPPEPAVPEPAEPELAIAASESNPIPTEPMTTETNPTSQDVTAAAIAELQDKLLGAIANLGDRLSEVEAKQSAAEQAEAERLEAERKAAEEEAQISAMAAKVIDAIAPSLDERIAAAIAPRTQPQQPRRITTAPLLRTGTTPVAAANDPIATLKQQLDNTPVSDRATRIAIKDEMARYQRNA